MRRSFLKNFIRGFLVVGVGSLIFSYYWFSWGELLSLEKLKDLRESIAMFRTQNPLRVVLLFFLVYVVSTAVSLPGATILTIAAGVIFGSLWGTVYVSFASTLGATLAMLGSRFLLRDLVRKKFGDKVEAIDRGIQKDGAFYLFSLRLIPAFPFFLVNLVMGLTSIRIPAFFIVSQIGMLPGTFVYVNAGTELSKISSLKEIMSPGLLLSLAMVGVLPLVSRFVMGSLKSGKHLRRFKRPNSFDYNMVVIGGGSAGLVSAYIAAAVKAKVALIEKHKMGGDCLNTGCVPSKAFIRAAKVLKEIKQAREYGFEVSGFQVNFRKVMERVQKVIAEIAPHDSVERYTALGVECIQGEANILSPYEIEVNGRRLTTKNIVVATGAGPFIPKIPGLSDVSFLTSDNVWNLRELPQRLVVLGGGPIGCELAQSFARMGSQVTIIERSPFLLNREDPEVSDFVAEKFRKEGVSVFVRHNAVRIEGKTLLCDHQGQEIRIPFDEILVALGRKANVTGFGLENLNVEISEQGTVVADELLRTTNYPNIYVCGDVTGPYQLTHAASHQAWYVAVNALFSPFKTYRVDYRVIPWCTFTDPEVARVGLNESEARQKGIAFQVSRYGLDDLDRAIAEGEAHGFVKVLTAEGSDRILGVTIVGHNAGEIIAEFVAAMKHGIGLNKILGTIHIYPTFAEANKYAAGVWKKANAPKRALEILRKYHSWRRS